MRRQGEAPRGKLAKLAQQWASGGSLSKNDAEFLKDCERFGIDPEAIKWGTEEVAERVLIWPDMQASVSLFFAMGSQWRWASVGMAGVMRTGLDYNVLEVTARSIGVEMTNDVFNDIRTLERAALDKWSSG